MEIEKNKPKCNKHIRYNIFIGFALMMISLLTGMLIQMIATGNRDSGDYALFAVLCSLIAGVVVFGGIIFQKKWNLKQSINE